MVSSSFIRLSSSSSAFFLSFSRARSCCRRHSSSSCCCCCKRNSCCWRRSSVSSRSCSNSNWRSRSRCPVSFFACRFSSSISSIYRLLDDRELAMLGCFLHPCVADCLEEISAFSSAFFMAPFPVSITVSSFGFLSPTDVEDTNDVWFPQSLLSLYCLIRS